MKKFENYPTLYFQNQLIEKILSPYPEPPSKVNKIPEWSDFCIHWSQGRQEIVTSR